MQIPTSGMCRFIHRRRLFGSEKLQRNEIRKHTKDLSKALQQAGHKITTHPSKPQERGCGTPYTSHYLYLTTFKHKPHKKPKWDTFISTPCNQSDTRGITAKGYPHCHRTKTHCTFPPKIKTWKADTPRRFRKAKESTITNKTTKNGSRGAQPTV